MDVIQKKLDEMTCAINNLQQTFEEHDSEIETVARESIGKTIGYVLDWKFEISGVDGQCKLFGVNIFDYVWKRTKKAYISKTHYMEKHIYFKYIVQKLVEKCDILPLVNFRMMYGDFIHNQMK